MFSYKRKITYILGNCTNRVVEVKIRHRHRVGSVVNQVYIILMTISQFIGYLVFPRDIIYEARNVVLQTVNK